MPRNAEQGRLRPASYGWRWGAFPHRSDSPRWSKYVSVSWTTSPWFQPNAGEVSFDDKNSYLGSECGLTGSFLTDYVFFAYAVRLDNHFELAFPTAAEDWSYKADITHLPR